MKKNIKDKARIPECRFKCNFMRYSEMIGVLDFIFRQDSSKLINKLKDDLVDLNDIHHALFDLLSECERQINFVENFLNDCGVNVYEA